MSAFRTWSLERLIGAHNLCSMIVQTPSVRGRGLDAVRGIAMQIHDEIERRQPGALTTPSNHDGAA